MFVLFGWLQVLSTLAKVDRILLDAGSDKQRILYAQLWFVNLRVCLHPCKRM
jgi:hypothetical protein